MNIKEILATYAIVTSTVLCLFYVVGIISLELFVTQMLLLTLPAEITLITIFPNTIGVIAVIFLTIKENK